MRNKIASILVLLAVMLLSLPSRAQSLVELPAGAEVQTWYFSGMVYDGMFGGTYERHEDVEVAIYGNEVYLRDIFGWHPDAWIKGTINGNTVTFAQLQYLGTYNGSPCYAIGADTTADGIQDFLMTYDKDAQTLTSVNKLLANVGNADIMPLEGFENFTISKDKPAVEDPTASTGANIDVLPYSNALATAEDFSQFGVLDTNEDGQTWRFSDSYGTHYEWANYTTGDDWLVSPAIKLEAGKHYRFSIDACHYYNTGRRFEVKIAKGEAKASVLAAGIEVIPAVDVTALTFTTYENKDFTVSETGYYHFGIHSISPSGYDYLSVASFFVEAGPDATTPAAVDNLKVTPLSGKVGATVTFITPTRTVGGTSLSAGDITKIEILRDDAVIKTYETPDLGVQLTYTDEAADLTIGNHKYQVVSYGTTGVGGKTDAIVVSLSGILTVPTSFDLSKQDVFNIFQTIDANEDEVGVWNWDASTGTRYYGSEKAADDYLVSSGIQLEAGKTYTVTVTARCHIQDVPERFEVKVGKEATVAGLNLTAMKPTTVTNNAFENYESEFTVPESGIYYVAIHAISDADMWRLYVNRLAIDEGLEGNAPAAPTLIVEAGAQGAERATITVTAPTKTIDGETLSDNLTKLELLRGGAILNTFTNVKPGAVVTFADEYVTTGSHAYQAIPYDANGAGQKSEKVTVYVGEEREPANVKNLQIVGETATAFTFTWDEVEGKNNGYVNAANVRYDVVTLVVGENSDGDMYMYEGESFASVTGKTTVTANYPVDNGVQGYAYFGVKATIGENESDARANNIKTIVGAPYNLPMEETFIGNYVWFGSENASTMMSEDGHGDNTALALSAYDAAGIVTLETGKLNLSSTANPTLVFDAKQGTSTVDKITIYGIAPDGTTADIKTVTLTAAYQTHKVQVPANVKNGRWTRLGFKVDFDAAEKTVLLDNIKVLDLYQNDLSMTLTAPQFAQTGSKAVIKATVKNEGENAINGYTIVVNAGEQELLNETVNETLLSFATTDFTINLETAIFDKLADVTITATVTNEGDQNLRNNTDKAVISIKESSVPSAANVKAEDTAGGMVVSWNAPATDVASAAKTTETFEAGEAGWAFIDADGDGFNWDYIYEDAIKGWLAHSGCGIVYSNSFVSLSENYSTPLTPDNWLVSPKAVLDGTFKFWAIGQDPDDYAEHFQVYVSTTSATDVTTFEPVSEEFVATSEYAEYTVDLSAYAGKTGWITIRHFNVTDMFRLIVDDITYHIGIEKYNIYVDGVLKATVAADKTTATVEGIGLEGHSVMVSVVYADGRESMPVEANLPSGLDKVIAVDTPVDVYSLDGRLVRRQTTTLSGLKGVYIVGGKKVVLK